MNRLDFITNKEADILAPRPGDKVDIVDVDSLPNTSDTSMAGTYVMGPATYMGSVSGISNWAMGDQAETIVSGLSPISSAFMNAYSHESIPDDSNARIGFDAPQVVTTDLIRDVAREENGALMARVENLTNQLRDMETTLARLHEQTRLPNP